MSRYVDADALVIDFYDDYETKDDIYTYAYVSEVQIDSAPSIDIVFCKECRWWGKYSSKIGSAMFCNNDCSLGGQGIKKPDDFCSYGEREGK